MASIILEFFDAVNRHDLDGIEACYHEDYVSIQPCYPERRFEGRKAVRRIYEHLYAKVPGVRYDILRTSFTEMHDGKVEGFIEVALTDDIGQNNIKGVFIMEADNRKIRHGTLYMTPVTENAGNIASYVEKLAGHA